MRDDYKIKGTRAKIEIEVEKEVAELLSKMEVYSKHTKSELANTALRMFISRHHDFLPPGTIKG